MATNKSSKPKKTTQKQYRTIQIRRNLAVYAALLMVALVAVSSTLFTASLLIAQSESDTRAKKIMAIYDSLELGDDFRIAETNIFGEKRPYSYDSGRTYASSVEYGHRGKPTDAAQALRAKIEAAGFSYVGSEYEGSTSPQQHYKNADGNYIRVSTESAAVHNAIIYGAMQGDDGQKDDQLINHANEAPTHVTIKVNLDDNNE